MEASQNVAHTPTPWARERTTLNIARLIVAADEVDAWRIAPVDDERYAVAYVPADYEPAKQEANARFIVRAANAHDELVFLLEEAARDRHSFTPTCAGPFEDCARPVCARHRAALRKATEGA